jgi:hypothetical protein
MNLILPLVSLLLVGALIWLLGGSGFGRAQTQAWIDRTRSWPWFNDFLNRHHGKFRAAGHYVEFGALFLVLYWIFDVLFQEGRLRFNPVAAAVIGVVCAVAAVLDELHQLRSGTRQFRRVDFLHSCCGIAIAAALVFYQHLFRGLE